MVLCGATPRESLVLLPYICLFLVNVILTGYFLQTDITPIGQQCLVFFSVGANCYKTSVCLDYSNSVYYCTLSNILTEASTLESFWKILKSLTHPLVFSTCRKSEHHKVLEALKIKSNLTFIF